MNRQQYKEACCFLAIRKGFALARRGVEVHAISAAGHTQLISRSNTQETVWADAYEKLKPNSPQEQRSKIDPAEVSTTHWTRTNIDPDTGFVIRSE